MHPATCPLDCPDACGISLEISDGRLMRVRGRKEHGYSQGSLCAKTNRYVDIVHAPNRLLHPLVRSEPSNKRSAFRRASWDEALGLIAARTPREAGRVLALWYAGAMGMVARRFPLRAMHALGAVLVDETVCDAAADAGYRAVLGRPLGLDLEHVDDCDLVALWGCDMRRTHQHLQKRIKRLCARGVPTFVIDIYRTDTIQSVERWGGRGLIIRPGTDAALALTLARAAYENGAVDRGALRQNSVGSDEFETHVRAAHEPGWCSSITGLSVPALHGLAQALLSCRRPLLKTGVGFARRSNGGMSMRAVASLAAVLGFAERIHFESPAAFALDHDIERPDLRPAAAPTKLISHVGLGRELERHDFGAVFVWGHNPAVTCPDSRRVRAGLLNPALFLVVHEQFLTETANLADVVLPATTLPEQSDVFKSYGHRRMHYTRAALPPPGQARSNVAAFAAIARALGLPEACWDVTEEGLCEALLEANLHRLGNDGVQTLRAGRDFKLTPPRYEGCGTPSGKIELCSDTLAAQGLPAMATYVPDDGAGQEGAFQLLPAPSVHTHNSTYSHSAWHRAKTDDTRLYLHPDDAAAVGVARGELAVVQNAQGCLTFRVTPDANMPRGLARVDGFPRPEQVPEGIGVNALVSGRQADLGGGAVVYSTRVDIRRAVPNGA